MNLEVRNDQTVIPKWLWVSVGTVILAACTAAGAGLHQAITSLRGDVQDHEQRLSTVEANTAMAVRHRERLEMYLIRIDQKLDRLMEREVGR